jgi:serine O-acetyltransferase
MLFRFVRNVYGIEIKQGARIGRKVWIPHHMGVVVGSGAEIGDRCLIHQNVNIGAASVRAAKGRARIGNDVELGSGAQILGEISIGDGARIGANVVVTTDIPPYAIVFQAKPKVIQLPSELRSA